MLSKVLLTRTLCWLMWLSLGLAPAFANPMVHQDGVRLVDGHNQPLYLRGVNLGAWLNWEGWLFGDGILVSNSQILTRLARCVGDENTARFQAAIFDTFVTEDDFAAIETLGFNSVRLPLNYRVLESPAGWQRIDRTLDWADRHHLYVILDLHAAPGGQSRVPTADPPAHGTLWESASEQQQTVELWRAIALRYRDRTAVAGYDLLNEPDAPRAGDLVTLYRQIANAIRSVDTGHLVILEGNKLARDFKAFKASICDNEAYSFHMYTWFGDDRRRQLAGMRALSQHQHVPLWVGEFGQNTQPMMASTVQMYEDPNNGVSGWAYWTWKMAPARYPGPMTITPPANWMAVMHWVAAPLFKRVPERLAASKAMNDFVEACRLKQCTLNQETLHALLPQH